MSHNQIMMHRDDDQQVLLPGRMCPCEWACLPAKGGCPRPLPSYTRHSFGQTGEEQELKKTPWQMDKCAHLPSVVDGFETRIEQRLVELDLHLDPASD
jgi:hypothetical protein